MGTKAGDSKKREKEKDDIDGGNKTDEEEEEGEEESKMTHHESFSNPMSPSKKATGSITSASPGKGEDSKGRGESGGREGDENDNAVKKKSAVSPSSSFGGDQIEKIKKKKKRKGDTSTTNTTATVGEKKKASKSSPSTPLPSPSLIEQPIPKKHRKSSTPPPPPLLSTGESSTYSSHHQTSTEPKKATSPANTDTITTTTALSFKIPGDNIDDGTGNTNSGSSSTKKNNNPKKKQADNTAFSPKSTKATNTATGISTNTNPTKSNKMTKMKRSSSANITGGATTTAGIAASSSAAGAGALEKEKITGGGGGGGGAGGGSERGSGGGIDAHPYPRGSVIEVLYGVGKTNTKKKKKRGKNRNANDENNNLEEEEEMNSRDEFSSDEELDSYSSSYHSTSSSSASSLYSSSCSEDDNDNDESQQEKENKKEEKQKKNNMKRLGRNSDKRKRQQQQQQQQQESSKNNKDKQTDSGSNSSGSIRLCDIIDRALIQSNASDPNPAKRWRYYVHYRDFNRRMDEWITHERIVSPPSVGNAKVRAMKKQKEEEERKKRLIFAEQQQQQASAAAGTVVGEAGGGAGVRRKRKRGSVARTGGGGDLESVASDDTMATTATGSGVVVVSGTSSTVVGGGVVLAGLPRGGRSRRASSAAAIEKISASAMGMTGTTAAAGGGGSAATMGGMVAGGDGEEGEDGGAAAGRLTRRQKRKSRASTSTAEEGEGGEALSVVSSSSTPSAMATVAPSTGAGVGTTSPISTLAPVISPTATITAEQIGVDVIATIPAQELDEHEGLDEASLREHEEVTKVKNVAQIELGQYRMETWYFSPIPKELLKDGMVEVLYVCEFTLNFFTRKCELSRFQSKFLRKNRRHPPGNEIYRDGNLSMFEIDGFEEKIYCQNLCYIAKLFLDHKTLYFDVDPFLFYVLCEVDERGFHPVGYFSKEKYSDVGYNLACILTFPSHQRKGYGRFLISFSYELSKKEEKVGSPEKPMSDLGQQAYKPYWTSTIVDFLLNRSDESGSMSIMDISKKTSIMAEDIIFTLNQLGILKFINGVYFIAAERGLLERLAQKHPVKEPRVDPKKLHWTPFITDVKRDKFSIHSKKPSVEDEETRDKDGS